MLKKLQRTRNLQVVKFDEGIYHVSGDIFPIQIIHTAKLSKENNFWLRNLTNDLKANIELFEEVNDMCDALMEIVKPKVEAKVKEAAEKALEEGRIKGKLDLISKKLAKGMSVEEIAEWLEEPVETIQKLMEAI